MAKRKIEETFQAIQPRGRRGIPNAPVIDVGVTGTSDLAISLSQAAQQIAQLQGAYKQQADLITANTQAVQSNTTSRSGGSLASTAGHIASGFLGGGLGLLSPIISGIGALFGGTSTPVALPTYTPPPPVSISANLTSAGATGNVVTPANTTTQPSPVTDSSSVSRLPAQQITVNVQAMDSQSFMDRSSDIASAVREAMLNMHPINDVVASL